MKTAKKEYEHNEFINELLLGQKFTPTERHQLFQTATGTQIVRRVESERLSSVLAGKREAMLSCKSRLEEEVGERFGK